MRSLAFPYGPEAAWGACQRCGHVTQLGPLQACTAPGVTTSGRPVPCALARRHDGRCGPDARHLLWPTIDLAPHVAHEPARQAA